MRKLPSIAFAAAFAAAAFATPASAQQGSASGSCGPGGGVYGYRDVNTNMVNHSGETVPAFFFEVNYSGVPAPTTVGVIVRRNDELEDQAGVFMFTADSAGGTRHFFANGNSSGPVVEGGDPVGFNGPNPSSEGWNGNQTNPANHDNNAGNTFSPGTNRAREGHRDGPRDGGIAPTGGSSPMTGVFPGEYVFYVYTGSVGDVYNVKDGTVARNAFIADEKGYLGKFSCGISTNEGSGPG